MNDAPVIRRPLVLAVLAQVDHGKTTLVDRLLWLSGRESGPDETDSSWRETEDREKVIRLMPPAISLAWQNTEFHFLDIPIRYGAGRPLDRVLEMADGVIYIVDAAEGPVPQTRLALHAVLQRQLLRSCGFSRSSDTLDETVCSGGPVRCSPVLCLQVN